jgi:hypothetical protein
LTRINTWLSTLRPIIASLDANEASSIIASGPEQDIGSELSLKEPEVSSA